MKFCGIILSIYLLSLSVFPCVDKAPQAHAHDSYMSQNHQHADTNHNHMECSPLCSCHCCHIHFTISDISGFKTPVALLNDDFPSLHTSWKKDVIDRIWQPPQV